jgi:hypothetical protein
MMLGLVSASAEETDKAQKGPERIEANAAAEAAPAAMTIDTFLDRLMMAESGGQDAVRNPRSTAIGPFQFIEGTLLAVVRRHFAEETTSLSIVALLGLRQDRAFAQRAGEAYPRTTPHTLREKAWRRASPICASHTSQAQAAPCACCVRRPKRGSQR